MDLALALRVVAGWSPFDQLSQSAQARLAESLQPLRLRPGQKLFDFGSLPPGIALVVKGQLRLLGRDEKGEPFTIQRIGAGVMVGQVALLRGVAGQALAAALPTQLWLLPAENFLQALAEHPALNASFSSPSIEELYAAAAASRRPELPSKSFLRDWAANQMQEAPGEQQVLLLPPGTHSFPEGWASWLVSSDNFEGLEPGREVQGPVELAVRGKLPGRLLAQPPSWPPLRLPAAMVVDPDLEGDSTEPSVVLDPEWVESPGSIVAFQGQTDALEDWYGRLNDDGSFPQMRGEGPIDEPLACLRMLARHFDLPFRRDVLRRILADQLQREGSESIALIQLAAVCDLMGLRASMLEVNEAQLQRLPTPAVIVQEGRPLVIWQSGPLEALVGNPRRGQERLAYSDLTDFNGEGQLAVLCLERSATSPKARFGLSWFLPALMQHRVVLIQVLIASFFVQLFALLNPLLVQQIIDAVISQGNLSSLNVLGTLLVGMAVAQAVAFGVFRQASRWRSE